MVDAGGTGQTCRLFVRLIQLSAQGFDLEGKAFDLQSDDIVGGGLCFGFLGVFCTFVFLRGLRSSIPCFFGVFCRAEV